MLEITERLSSLVFMFGNSVNAFAKNIGVDTANLNKMVKGQQSITKKTVQKIISAYPQVSEEWLLTGEGEMLRHAPSQNVTENNNIVGNSNTGNNTIINNTQPNKDENAPPTKLIVPKYLTSLPNTDVYKVLKADGHTMQLDSMTAIPPYNNFDFYYMVRQDSMKPLFKEGDVLALAHTERGSDIIQGASMIIDTNDFGFLLRRIYDRGDYYECRIINENSSFETQNIAKTKVIRLYRIVYSIRLGD